MGWGAKAAAKPQPKALVDADEPLDAPSPVDEPRKAGVDDEVKWMSFRQYWAPQTQAALVEDFIRSKLLFGELVKFAVKRKR